MQRLQLRRDCDATAARLPCVEKELQESFMGIARRSNLSRVAVVIAALEIYFRLDYRRFPNHNVSDIYAINKMSKESFGPSENIFA